MELKAYELDFLLSAVDGVRCQSTAHAYTKGNLLQRLASELEASQGQKVPVKDVDDTDTVSDE